MDLLIDLPVGKLYGDPPPENWNEILWQVGGQDYYNMYREAGLSHEEAYQLSVLEAEPSSEERH